MQTRSSCLDSTMFKVKTGTDNEWMDYLTCFGVAQKILALFPLFLGHGVEKNMELGMSWFKKSADNGHPHASYNVGYGHIKKLHKLLNKGWDNIQILQIYRRELSDEGIIELKTIQSINQSSDNRPFNQSINQSFDQSVNQSSDKSTNQPSPK